MTEPRALTPEETELMARLRAWVEANKAPRVAESYEEYEARLKSPEFAGAVARLGELELVDAEYANLVYQRYVARLKARRVLSMLPMRWQGVLPL